MSSLNRKSEQLVEKKESGRYKKMIRSNRNLRWTDLSMAYHYLFYILGCFFIYTIVYIFYIHRFGYYYTKRLDLSISEAVIHMANESLSGILSSTVINVSVFFDILK